MIKTLLFFIFTVLSACSTPSVKDLIESANQQAISQGFSKSYINSDFFSLLSYQKFQKNSKHLVVYIEGDGKGWITRTQISMNPTPHNPIGLYLSITDSSANNLVYLSRPCQYHLSRTEPNCKTKYWASHRYSEEVIASTDKAIDKLKASSGSNSVSLIGFSGGATVALLVAARRTDVKNIKTVAGNLDHQVFTTLHKVTPLRGSLNPVGYGAKLRVVPQVHFIGSKDKVVPREIYDSYYAKIGGVCNKLIVVDGVSHSAGWEARWPKLNAMKIDCRQ